MGLDRASLPDSLLRYVAPADRRASGLSKSFNEVFTSIAKSALLDKPNMAKAHGAKYNLKIVLAWFSEVGLPAPRPEYRFDSDRQFRFDFAWLEQKVALEVQGGIFARLPGGHNRGAQIRREHEKWNLAALAGWRILYCETETLCMTETSEMIRKALAWP